MAVDKLVDSTQLDSDLTSVANAIREKGGTSAQLAFPADFVQAISDIPTGGGDSGLPEYYQQVEYVKNPSGAYFKTQVMCPDNFSAYVKCWMSAAPTGAAKVAFGLPGANSTPNYGLVFFSTSSEYLGTFIGANNTTAKLTGLYGEPVEATTEVSYTNRTVHFTAKNSGGTATKDGSTSTLKTTDVFRVFYYNAASQQFAGKIYEVIVTNTDTNAKILHLIPSYAKDSGVVGMYDLVNRDFYHSDTTTALTKGPDVVSDSEALSVLLGG